MGFDGEQTWESVQIVKAYSGKYKVFITTYIFYFFLSIPLYETDPGVTRRKKSKIRMLMVKAYPTLKAKFSTLMSVTAPEDQYFSSWSIQRPIQLGILIYTLSLILEYCSSFNALEITNPRLIEIIWKSFFPKDSLTGYVPMKTIPTKAIRYTFWSFWRCIIIARRIWWVAYLKKTENWYLMRQGRYLGK